MVMQADWLLVRCNDCVHNDLPEEEALMTKTFRFDPTASGGCSRSREPLRMETIPPTPESASRCGT